MRRTWLVFALFAAACASTHGPPRAQEPTVAAEAQVAAAPSPPPSPPRGSGELALMTRGADVLAIVADEDPPSVRGFDIAAGRELWTRSMDGAPGHLVVLKSGRVLVTNRAAARVEALDPPYDAGLTRFADTCTEPIGIAASPDEETAYVACGWDHTLLAISLRDASVSWRLDLPVEPRAVLATSDGAHVVVSHASGSRASVIDVKARAAMTVELRGAATTLPKVSAFGQTGPGAAMITSNGFALAEYEGTVYLPLFVGMADRGPNVASEYYGGGISRGVVYPIDPAEAIRSRWLYARVQAVGPPEIGCLAPRGVAVRGKKERRTLVACPGSDEVVEQSGENILRRITVPGGPTAIAADPSADRAFVWSAFDRVLWQIDLDKGGELHGIPATGAPLLSERLRKGKRLFLTTSTRPRTYDGRACATCHPDGRADGLTWGTLEGPRQTAMLTGRLEGTAPYGWTRGHATLHEYVKETIRRVRLMTMSKPELDSVVAYISQLRAPARPVLASSAVARGKALFESTAAGCSTCHRGAALTDGKSHDVGSRTDGDGDRARFDTPSLRFVANTAPYFHDGRYGTLHELLADVDGKMGHTSHLSPRDLDALEAYLRSL